jgi:D-alanyl-D-alanine dipeptidase
MAQVKTPAAPPAKKPFARSLQALVVTTGSWDAVQGTARLFERSTPGSEWKPAGEPFPIVVGRSGLGADPDQINELVRNVPVTAKPVVKREGDGRSPAGMFPLTFAFGSKSLPATRLPFTELKEFTECVDDVNSNHYNTVVDRMQVGNFDWKSSEKMLEVGEAYERGVFVAYNSYPPQKGNGSCIFLHIWKDANSGTSGCTAMKRADIENLLSRLDPAKNPYLVQFPIDVYASHQKSWKLPKLN